MRLTQIQAEVGTWARYNFGDNRGIGHIAPLLGMGEELGELIHEVLKEQQGIRAPDKAKERDAVGDMLIYLLDFCARRGYSAERALDDAWEHVRLRDWRTFPKNGISE